MGSSRCPRSTRTASWTRSGRPRSATASSAARIVRPVNRTSSTRTTVRPLIDSGTDVTPIRGLGAAVEIVPIQPDIEHPDGDSLTFDIDELSVDSLRQWNSSGVNPKEHDRVGTVVSFEDFVSDAPQRPADVARVHHLSHDEPSRITGRMPTRSARCLPCCMLAPFRPHRTELKVVDRKLAAEPLPPDSFQSSAAPSRSFRAMVPRTPFTNRPLPAVE